VSPLRIFRDARGLTVVELLIALGVITVGLFAVIAAMPLGTSQIGEANLRTTATFLAQQRLEQIKNARWTVAVDTLGGAGLDGTAAPTQWPDEDYRQIALPSPAGCATVPDGCYPRFRRQVRIADCSIVVCSGIPVATAGANTLRRVTVTVLFFPIAGTGQRLNSEESVALVTLMTRRA
jgi:hypothetical protein